jgi:hypothetical protein
VNVYRTSHHHRPLLVGMTDADAGSPDTDGFATDLFLHPGGAMELAIYLRKGDDPSRLPGWRITKPQSGSKEIVQR